MPYIYGLGIHTLGIIISNPMRYGTFSYLGIIYFLDFTDFVEFIVDKFLYLGSKDILPPNKYT